MKEILFTVIYMAVVLVFVAILTVFIAVAHCWPKEKEPKQTPKQDEPENK